MSEDVTQRIAELLSEHHPTRGMAVAMGVTCSCGEWVTGGKRSSGADGLDAHRAEVLHATLAPELAEVERLTLDRREWIAKAEELFDRATAAEAEVEGLRAVLAIGEALASTCDLDPATPHCCISLIAAHDLALALASVPEPSEGVFRAPTSFPESEVTPIAAAEGARDNFKQLWVQSTRVAERVEGRLRAVAAELPDECWITRLPESRCTSFIGATIGNGVFTKEMACLPCRVRVAIESEPAPVKLEPVLADERSRPKRCPRCGEDCVYDGWDWTHASGYGVGSCPMEGE